MERSHLVDGFAGHRPQNQPLMMGGQLTSEGSGLFYDRGFEDLFAKMDLSDEVGNMGSSPGMDNRFLRVGGDAFLVGGDNLVPRFADGVYGANVGMNDYHMLYNNGCYSSVGSPFGTVHGDLESHQSKVYQAEVQRVQMIEFWRRNSLSRGGHLLGEMGWPVSPYLARNGADLAALDSRGFRGNRAVASYNVAGLSPGPEQGVDEVNLMDLRGQILGLATDQFGCKMLQMKFGDVKVEEIEMVLDEVIDNVSSLMMDQFGNYLVQKLIEVCSEEQRTRIIRSVTQNSYQLIRVCLNPHGTRAVQKLLEKLTTEQQISMVTSALSPGVVALIKDGNGYHVIQHCLKNFSDKHNRFLVNEIARNCYEIATDKSGCCVLQVCLDITKGEVKEHLIARITANALPLSEDRYGNYVVQHLLQMKVPNVTAKLVNELSRHFFSLACNKYGSNVVEKCLTETGGEFSELVILELLNTPGISKLLQDPFGNYVFQSALSVSQGLLHAALVSLVRTHSASMCSNLYGKKILSWFDNRKRLSHNHTTMRS